MGQAAPREASKGGSCNTLPPAIGGSPAIPPAAGVDTARFLYRITSDATAAIRTVSESYGDFHRIDRSSGELLKTGLRYGITELGGSPGLWVEGRPIQLVREQRGIDELMPTVELPVAEQLIRDHLADRGIKTDPAGLSRLDLTAEGNREGTVADRSAILRGVSALTVPRRKTEVFFDNRTNLLETVYLVGLGRTPRKHERIYAACGTHSEAAAGTVRFEAQTRHSKQKRMTAEGWDERTCAQTFEERFATMSKAAKGITVAGPTTLHKEIHERIKAEEMTARKAMRLLGYIDMCAAGLAHELPERTRYRIAAELREEGLVAADNALEGGKEYERFDLGAAFEEISVAFSLN